jgi:hypothetical protein
MKSEKVEPTGGQKRTTRHGLFLNEVELGGVLSSSLAAIETGRLPVRHQVWSFGKSISPTIYLVPALWGRTKRTADMDIPEMIVGVTEDPSGAGFFST